MLRPGERSSTTKAASPAGSKGTRRLQPLDPPWPPLASEKAALRVWELSDARSLAQAWADPTIQRFSPVPDSREVADAEAWIGGGAYRRLNRISIDLVICAPGESTVMGEIGLWNFNGQSRGAMLGYWVQRPYRGRGIAAEAVALLVDWAMDPNGLDLRLVVAKVDRNNAASEKLLRSLGFRLERNDVDGHRLFTRRTIDVTSDN